MRRISQESVLNEWMRRISQESVHVDALSRSGDLKTLSLSF